MEAAPDPDRTAALFERVRAGDAAARDELVAAVYDELRRIAAREMRGQPGDHTLQVTALVHEAYVRLVDDEGRGGWDDRAHFLGAAARAMRTALVDHARARNAAKRGGGAAKLPLEAIVLGFEEDGVDLIDLDLALERLRELDPRGAEVVELRTFGGLTEDEAAEVLDVSPRTVRRLWSTSRIWLRRELDGGD